MIGWRIWVSRRKKSECICSVGEIVWVRGWEVIGWNVWVSRRKKRKNQDDYYARQMAYSHACVTYVVNNLRLQLMIIRSD